MPKFNDFIVEFKGNHIKISNKEGRYSIGTLLDSFRSSGYDLTKKDSRSQIDPFTISRYYRMEHEPYRASDSKFMPYSGRFIVYKNGTCELSTFGSGVPIIDTEFGTLI